MSPGAPRRAKLLVLALTAGSAVAAWLLLSVAFKLPSDEALEAQLEKRRASLAQLLELAEGDPLLEAVELGAVRPASAAPGAERLERYRSLLAGSGLRALVRERGEVRLVAATLGIAGRVVTEGFVRPAAPPAPLAGALAPLARSAAPGQTAYKPGGGGWYLFVEVR